MSPLNGFQSINSSEPPECYYYVTYKSSYCNDIILTIKRSCRGFLKFPPILSLETLFSHLTLQAV